MTVAAVYCMWRATDRTDRHWRSHPTSERVLTRVPMTLGSTSSCGCFNWCTWVATTAGCRLKLQGSTDTGHHRHLCRVPCALFPVPRTLCSIYPVPYAFRPLTLTPDRVHPTLASVMLRNATTSTLLSLNAADRCVRLYFRSAAITGSYSPRPAFEGEVSCVRVLRSGVRGQGSGVGGWDLGFRG